MIRQMLKLIWKRKRSNGFLVAELLLTFFVLYAAFTVGFNTMERYTRPAGFSVENVLNINIQKLGARGNSREKAPVVAEAVRILKDMPETAAIGITEWELFQMNQTYNTIDVNGKNIQASYAFLDDGCAEALQMDVVRGRWYSEQDDGSEYIPVVVNQQFVTTAFGDADPLGKLLQDRMVIVGVISDYRLYGPFDKSRDLIIQRKPTIRYDASDIDLDPEIAGDIILRVHVPVTAELNARILNAIQHIAPDWSFNISSAEALRDARVKEHAIPYLTAGMAATSLIGMVILGLFGVLWQNIASRTREIGLRRAKGANIGHIFMQIIGEMLLVTTVGVVPGIVIVAQLMAMDVLGNIPFAFHLAAIIAAAAVLYLMVAVCSLYPGYLATRINPAQALHYE